jgi:hypothetical protein
MFVSFDEDEGTWHLTITDLDRPADALFTARYIEFWEAESAANFLQSITGITWEKL